MLRVVLTFKISNIRKDRGFDSRIYIQIIWYTYNFPLSALIKSLMWVFRIASKFPYLNQKKMIFEKNHAYKCWQRKEPNMPCNLFIDSAVKITFLFCVRNIEGWNHSEHPVFYYMNSWKTGFLEFAYLLEIEFLVYQCVCTLYSAIEVCLIS